jgi:hypothetical protein
MLTPPSLPGCVASVGRADDANTHGGGALSHAGVGRLSRHDELVTPVVLGLRSGNDFEVLSGLSGTETSVQSRANTLAEGQAEAQATL